MKGLFKLSLIQIIFLIISVNSLYAQEFVFPKPSGPHEIGTRYFYLSDKNRPDIFTADSNDYRNISMQVWYPAEIQTNSTPKNFNDKKTAEFCVNAGFFLPTFVNEIAQNPSHSYLNAKLAKKDSPFPVIFYSASGVLDANIFLAEELASQGYMVFCVGHPHWCAYYFDSNGHVIFRDQENDTYNKQLWQEENSDAVRKLKEQLTAARTVEDKLFYQKKLNDNAPMEITDLQLWVEDIGFVIDELQKMNKPGKLFDQKLDLENIGIMGYSKGGAAAGLACLNENRCKAGINLSGFMFGDIAEKELQVPFMVMESNEPWCQNCLPINDLLYHTSKSSIYMVQVDSATHGNFCDITVFKDYLTDNHKNIVGPIDGRTFLNIQKEYVLQFFNKHIKMLPETNLEKLHNKYRKVKFKSSHS